MKFFVRNLFTKILLLSALLVPMALYAFNEFKQIAKASGELERPAPPIDPGLKTEQDEAAKLAAMPVDIRLELIFPSGGPIKVPEDGSPYRGLATSVSGRAKILAGHRSFLEEFSDEKNVGDESYRPKYSVDDQNLQDNYRRIFNGGRSYRVLKAKIKKTREKLASASGTDFPQVKKDLERQVDDLESGWPKDPDIAVIRSELAEYKVKFAFDGLVAECKKMEAKYQVLVGKTPSPEALEKMIGDVAALLKELNEQEMKARAPSLKDQRTIIEDEINKWTKRHQPMQDALPLIKREQESVEADRADLFLRDCANCLKNHPSNPDAARILRGLADDFCTRFLTQPPKKPLTYDNKVDLTGYDGTDVPHSRKQVRIVFKVGKGKFLEDPETPGSYTEFDAMNDETAEKVTGYKDDLDTPVDNLKGLPLKALHPTALSKAVHLYRTEYSRVKRWDAKTIKDYQAKCLKHKDKLGDVWDRLNFLAETLMNEDLKDLFDLR